MSYKNQKAYLQSLIELALYVKWAKRIYHKAPTLKRVFCIGGLSGAKRTKSSSNYTLYAYQLFSRHFTWHWAPN